MNSHFFIARRYLRRRSKGYLFLAQVFAVVSVAVGVSALILVLGVMSGFEHELKSKIIGVLPPVMVRLPAAPDSLSRALEILPAVPGVEALAPYTETQAIMRSRHFLAGGQVRAVDPAREDSVTGIKRHLLAEDRASALAGLDGLLLGSELARTLNVGPGDTLELITGYGFSPDSWPVSGVFRTGLYHFDATLVLMPLAMGEGLFPGGANPEYLGVGTSDIYAADVLSHRIREALGPGWGVESWIDRNQALFSALALERRAMAVVLALIVIVAGFNIANSLMMIVWRKSREIGVLRSLGVTTGGIRAIFLWMGLLTGFWGVLAGLAFGLGLAFVGDHYQLIKLPGEFYELTYLPIRTSFASVAWISVLALFVSLVSSFVPAQKAARITPAVTLRAE